MNQELDKQQQIQQEIAKKKKEQERQLIIKAHQIRAVCMTGDTEFFKIGQEECDLLRKIFPDEADKLLAQATKEKFNKAEKKEQKAPGSVDRSSLLQEIEGLCSKAFKLMMENMKKSSKPAEQKESGLSDAEKNIGNAAQMSEVENVKEEPKKVQEMPKESFTKDKKKDNSFANRVKENVEDGYQEGMTGIKVERPKEEEPVKLSKKEQKKLDKEQKKSEKAQKKAEKAQKHQKVAPISKDAIDQARGGSVQKSAEELRQDEINKQKLEEYNKRLQERVSAKEKSSQMSNQNVREMSGPARKKN